MAERPSRNAATEVGSHAVEANAEQTRGGRYHFSIVTENVEVARELGEAAERIVNILCKTAALTIATCYVAMPIIGLAIKNAFGGDREDQDIGDPTIGSLHVQVRCFTDERFLEVLADYESGEIKHRLEKELVDVGIKVEGLRIGIENMDEVEKRNTAIKKRYISHCKPHQ